MDVKIVHADNRLFVLDRDTDDPIKGRFGYPISLTYGDMITYDEAMADLIRETLRLGHVIQEIDGQARFVLSQISYYLE